MSQPFILVDINRISGLSGISFDGANMRIGATTRQADALAHRELAKVQPVVFEALRHVGHHQTRNRGTIGGSIALGEPAAELPATAMALGAQLELHSNRGERRVAAEDFYVGPYLTTIEPDELLVAVHFPGWPASARTIFREVAQRPGDFALVGLVGALHVENDKVARVGLAWFGMAPTPVRARKAEAALQGASLREIDAEAIADLAIADTDPFDDLHATAAYRRTVGRSVFVKALRGAFETGIDA
jgi:carbon-monoxide dehydrogenase medium subunit